jgi:hypothetical protein
MAIPMYKEGICFRAPAFFFFVWHPFVFIRTTCVIHCDVRATFKPDSTSKAEFQEVNKPCAVIAWELGKPRLL